jgi:hypothetical protein
MMIAEAVRAVVGKEQYQATRTVVGQGQHRYEWIDDWADLPETASAARGWAHPGCAVTAAGEVVTVHPAEPRLLFFAPDGRLRRSWRVDVTEAHGLAVTGSGAAERVWLADSGAKRQPGAGYGYAAHAAPAGGQVVELTLDGHLVRRLARPDHPAYREGRYLPTSVAVDDEGLGGSGDIWVADGYGQNLVHRFRQDGSYAGSFAGAGGTAGGAGASGSFKTPHAVVIDRRKEEPELYVADRANHRLQVFDLQGRFKRIVGADVLTSPSAFALAGNLLVVAELRARLVLFDAQDRLVGTLGAHEAVCDAPGWPNRLDAAGSPIRPLDLRPGRFNSPHGVAAGAGGALYVAEWLIGGRYTKLVPLR